MAESIEIGQDGSNRPVLDGGLFAARMQAIPGYPKQYPQQWGEFDDKLNLETRIVIRGDGDIVKARQTGRSLVQKMGFSSSRVALVTTAISELARNIVLYAALGEIVLFQLNSGGRFALVIVAQDRGPGIANIGRVLAGGFSTSGGLGLGLCGLRHIVDQFDINSGPGQGTQVVVRIGSG